MIPPILTFPDSLSEKLDAALASMARIPNGYRAKPSAQRMADVADILFPKQWPPEDTTEEERLFLREFQEAVNGLSTGHTAPALQLENLPTRHSERFVSALFSILQGDIRNAQKTMPHVIGTIHDLGFHQDMPYYKGVEGKLIRGIYCRAPGAEPDPTIFLTADEVIHAMACDAIGLPVTATVADVEASHVTGDYGTARERLIKSLANVQVFTRPQWDDDATELQPFLQPNPNFAPGSSAPEFFNCCTPHDQKFTAGNSESLKDFFAMTEQLRDSLRASSTASTKANSLVLFNDGGVIHDRASEPRAGRVLLSDSARPFIAETASMSPTSRYTAGAVCAWGGRG